MTTAEAAEYIGRHGMIRTGGLDVQVTILDVKVSYGRTRYLVQPQAGKGSVWVESVAIFGNAAGVAL